MELHGFLEERHDFEQRVADAPTAEMFRVGRLSEAVGPIAEEFVVPFESEDNHVRSDELLIRFEIKRLRPVVVDTVPGVSERRDQPAVRERYVPVGTLELASQPVIQGERPVESFEQRQIPRSTEDRFEKVRFEALSLIWLFIPSETSNRPYQAELEEFGRDPVHGKEAYVAVGLLAQLRKRPAVALGHAV